MSYKAEQYARIEEVLKMGNWITVNAIGKVSEDEAQAMINILTYDNNTYTSEAGKKLGILYLQIGRSVFGINQWVNESGEINSFGNVFERDCEVDDLVLELTALSDKFKTLDMVLHVGGDYESKKCVATIKVLNGEVTLLEPQIHELLSK